MKKLLAAILILTISFFALSSKALAQENLGDILEADEPSQEQFLMGNLNQPGLISDNLPNAITVAIIGAENTQGETVKQGALPYVTSTIAYMYENQPTSSTEYFANVFKNIGIPTPQKTQAQGTGYEMLESMIPLWEVFRNLAYSIYIIIFVVIGFMIMFRTKINAQTVISIQSALPNLIITLLLITFSYAIAGFLVDLMYLSIYLIAHLFSSVVDPSQAIQAFNQKNALSSLFSGDFFILRKGSSAVEGMLFGLKEGGALKKVVGSVVGGLSGLIITVAVFIQMLKLLWQLLKSYLLIIIQTITAPLQILPNAIPGQNSFIGWLKKTTSHLAPFPIAAAMLLFANLLTGPIVVNGQTYNPFGVKQNLIQPDNVYFPPLLFNTGVDSQSLGAILGLVVILMTPSAVQMAQKFFQTEESPYGSQALQSLGFPAAQAQQFIQRRRQISEQRGQMREQARLSGSAIADELKEVQKERS